MYYFLKPCENCISLQEQGDESSAESFLDIPASVLSKLNLTAAKSCSNANETASCHDSQYGMTCEPSTANHGADSWMSCAGDSPVRTLVPQAQQKQELTATGVDCGTKWQGSLARYDRHSHSLKTRQSLLFSDSTESLVTLPHSGLMRNGMIFRLPTWEGHISEKGCSFWPTPLASDFRNRGSRCGKGQWNLSHVLHLHGRLDLQLSSRFREWMMGWPIGWTDLKPLETDKFQQWLRSHGEHFQDSNIK